MLVNPSRVLVLITALQALIILYLFFEVKELNDSIYNLSLQVETTDYPNVLKSDTFSAQPIEKEQIDYEVIRNTIRQSVESYFKNHKNHKFHNDTIKNNNVIEPARNQQVFEQVELQLNSLIGSGLITVISMDKLHNEITSLNTEDQKLILSRMAMAINSGQLKVAR